MKEIKQTIIKLRLEGKSYNEIARQLNCNKSLICYYCGEQQKEKCAIRRKKYRNKIHPYIKKIETFRYSKNKYLTNKKQTSTIYKLIYAKIHLFIGKQSMKDNSITVEKIIEKFGENPKCYLTGDTIDIYQTRTYHFDHIIPKSRGGDNSINNLGLCTKLANQSKTNMTLDEYIELCKSVLENFGYEVKNSIK